MEPVQNPVQLEMPDWAGRKDSVRKMQNLTVEVEQKMLHGVVKDHHWGILWELVLAQPVHLMTPISGPVLAGLAAGLVAVLAAGLQVFAPMSQIPWLSVAKRKHQLASVLKHLST